MRVAGCVFMVAAMLPASASAQIFRDPSVPIEKRVADLVGRMTLEEKVGADAGHRAGHPAARRARLQLVERGAARRRARRLGDRVPAGDRHGGDVGRRRCCTRWRTSSPTRRAPSTTSALRHDESRALSGPHLLVAEHQHLPRSALGTRAGDLRRGSVSSPARSAVAFIAGLQGDDPQLLQDRRDARSTSPCTAGRSPTRHSFDVDGRARATCARPICPHFAAAVAEGGAYRSCAPTTAVDGKPACANTELLERHPARRVGVPGLRRLGLRRDRRHLPRPQVSRDRRRGGGRGREDRHGPRLRLRAMSIANAREGGEAGADHRGARSTRR